MDYCKQLNTDFWSMVNIGDLMDYYEQDHERGQSFDDWLEDMQRAGFVQVGNDGEYYMYI